MQRRWIQFTMTATVLGIAVLALGVEAQGAGGTIKHQSAEAYRRLMVRLHALPRTAPETTARYASGYGMAPVVVKYPPYAMATSPGAGRGTPSSSRKMTMNRPLD